MEGLALIVRALRKRAGMSQMDLAKKAKVSQSSVSRLEKGSDVTLSVVKQIAVALETSEALLLHRAGMIQYEVNAVSKAKKALKEAVERAVM